MVQTEGYLTIIIYDRTTYIVLATRKTLIPLFHCVLGNSYDV
jgi:hypothetical protein